MSFSKPVLQNPSKKFIEWSSEDACFTYYDKDQSKNVLLPLPVYFIVLDQLSTITGFCKKHKCSIYSNEVRSIIKEPFLVKTFKGGERLAGMYNDIKGSIKELGGKFTASVYAMLIQEGQEPELVNIKLKGSAFSTWLDKKINTGKYIIQVKEAREEVNGTTVYNVPVFSKANLTPTLTETGILMDQMLQEYLKEYLAQQQDEVTVAAEAAPEPQPSYVADMDAKLRQVVSKATSAPNAILDSGWVKESRKNKEKTPAITSDPALLEEGPRNIDPEDLEPGVDDLPF